MNSLNMENYLSCIRDKLKEVLINKNFTGKLEIEINAKEGGITNMNIGVRESIKI